MKTNLLNYNLNGLTDHFAQMGEKPFRAKQVMRWIHQSGAQTFDEMTDLAKALRDFITFEYVMLDGINDKPEHARELVQLVKDTPCKFNLIPFNPFPNSGYERSSNKNINIFKEILMEADLVTTVRKTRGDDIDAACGQLAGQVQDKTKRQAKWQQIYVESNNHV